MEAIRIRAACLALEGEERVLLVQHHKAGRDYWLLPGGGVEPGETLAEAARRELREETGLDGEVGPLVLACESIDPAGERHILHVVFATRVEPGVLQPGIDGRLVAVAWLPVEALGTLPLFPAVGDELLAVIRDGRTGPARYLGNVWRSAAPTDDD